MARYAPRGHDYFRPFSCNGFYPCPSNSRKRARVRLLARVYEVKDGAAAVGRYPSRLPTHSLSIGLDQELGDDFSEKLNSPRLTNYYRRKLEKLEKLGYDVSITPRNAA